MKVLLNFIEFYSQAFFSKVKMTPYLCSLNSFQPNRIVPHIQEWDTIALSLSIVSTPQTASSPSGSVMELMIAGITLMN